MLQINFKECCRRCGCIDVEVEEISFGEGLDRSKMATTIECRHQCVCKEYREQSEDMRLVKP